MNVLSHGLASFVLARILGLDNNLTVIAIIFGVLPDIDHIFRVGEYYHENHWHLVKEWPWRTSFQELIGLVWVVPIAFLLGTTVPIIFFLLHLLLDYTMTYTKHPFAPFSNFQVHGFFPENGKFEIAFISILAGSLIWLI